MSETETPKSETNPTDPFSAQRAALNPAEAEYVRSVEAAWRNTGDGGFQLERGQDAVSAFAERMRSAAEDRDRHLALFEQRVLIDKAGLTTVGPSKHALLTAVLSAQRSFEAAQRGYQRALWAKSCEENIAAAKAKAEALIIAGGSRTEAAVIVAQAEVDNCTSGDARAAKGRLYDLKLALAREQATA
jgi:hypothetical protein